MANTHYFPSNSTNGEEFMDNYCMNCANDNMSEPGNKRTKVCDILAGSFQGFPAIEWTFNEKDEPVCTAFKEHDWRLGDPDEVDPAQLELEFEMEEQG